MDASTLIFSLIFSSIGLGYLSYGRKHNTYFMIAGIGLLAYPYFVYDLGWIIGIGVFLLAIPFILDRMLD